jgi:MFS family permease
MYKASYWILFASCALWLISNSYPTLVLFSIVMGVGYGGIAAMTPAAAAQRFGGEGLGELLGFLMTSFGVACLIGIPAAGVMVDTTHDFRWPIFIAAGSALLALVAISTIEEPGRLATPEAAAD